MKHAFVLCAFLFVAATLVAQNKPKTENVFLITLDGLRWQELFAGADAELIENKKYVEDASTLQKEFWDASPEKRREMLMPFFWTVIAKQGQLYGNRQYDNFVNCTNTMWFSYPGYNEILCGFADDKRINSNDKIDNPNKTLLEVLNNNARFKGKVAAFGSWDVFPFIINEKRSGVPVNAGFESVTDADINAREKFLNQLQQEIPSPFSSVRLDAFTHHFALEYLKKRAPKVLYIAYGETDDFAHAGKYDAYLRSAHQTDQFIRQLWEWVQSHPKYKDKTTFIITTDHGRGTVPLDSWKGHGSDIEGADQIWAAVLGPDSPALGELKKPGQIYQSQIAKTMGVLLNFDYQNEKSVGPVIPSVFKGSENLR